MTPLRLSIAMILALAAGGCGPPTSVWPRRTPAALPSGAIALAIDTASPAPPQRRDVIATCPDAEMEPVEVVRDGDRLNFVIIYRPGWPVEHVGDARPVTWPRGFSARLVNGRGELVAPDGTVVAVEGDLLYGGIGGSGPLPGSFQVCSMGSVTYSPAS